jgi:Zn-dependent protease with chaperone function
VKVDTANRSFATLLGASLLAGMFVFCGAVGCVLVVLVASEIGHHGLDALSTEDHDLWPAVVFIALVGVGAAVGVLSLVRQILASRRLGERLQTLALPMPTALATCVHRTGLPGRVVLVDSGERFSFAYGALTPRVAVSRGFFDAASADELSAVLEHERYHVSNLDPLKVVLARSLPAAFFYLPAFRSLNARYVAGRELAADRRALESCGRRPVAGALFKVVRGPAWPELQTAAAIGGPELLDVRLAQLETGTEPRVATPTPGILLLSLVGALALVGLFVFSVVSFGGVSAVAHTTGANLRPLDIGGAILCVAPWAAAVWLGYRWLSRRNRRQLTTTPP